MPLLPYMIFLGIATRCGVTANDGAGNAIVEIDGVAYDIKSADSCAAYKVGGCTAKGVDSITGYAGAADKLLLLSLKTLLNLPAKISAHFP